MNERYKIVESRYLDEEDIVHIENVSYDLAHVLRKLLVMQNEWNANDIRVVEMEA